jgi:hypothetical protein
MHNTNTFYYDPENKIGRTFVNSSEIAIITSWSGNGTSSSNSGQLSEDQKETEFNF